MGDCISIHRKGSARAVKRSSDFTNKPDHTPVIDSTHSNRKLPVVDGHVTVKPQLPPSQLISAFSDFGSKEEIFYDSHAWLDSDFEDEFMSVNGEFTPSRGNTPVYHSLTPSRRYKSMDHFEPHNSTPQLSSTLTEKRKRLLDFFKESTRENHGSSNEEFAEPPTKYDDNMISKIRGSRPKRKRLMVSMQGCFTGLLSGRNTSRQNSKAEPRV